MYGCTPYTGAEYAPLRLPSFSYTSIQRPLNPCRMRAWYSGPSGATDSTIGASMSGYS